MYKLENGKRYPASAFLYVPDAAKPSTWALRYKDFQEGKLKVSREMLYHAAATVGPAFIHRSAVPVSWRNRLRVSFIPCFVRLVSKKIESPLISRFGKSANRAKKSFSF